MNITKRLISLLLPVAALLAFPLQGGERPRVVVLHPVLEEMVNRLADGAAEVTCLLPSNADLHGFDPSPGQMMAAQQADLVVAMGKHLEPYLDRLTENLSEGTKVYEAGRLVPSVKIDPSNEMFVCCPTHSHGAIDPHWWHSPLAVRRAVRHLGRELEDLLPDHKKDIRSRTREVMKELESLHAWAEEQLSAVPRDKRKLVTAHAAFGYFCVEYDFMAVPVKGLTAERSPSPAFLKDTLETLRREQIRAVFPEDDAPDAFLETMRESAGVTIAEHLHADFLSNQGETYDQMFRANVTRIVDALAPPGGP